MFYPIKLQSNITLLGIDNNAKISCSVWKYLNGLLLCS